MAPRLTAAADAEACRLQGIAEPNIDTEIRNAEGEVIARLTGSSTPLEIRQLPLMPSAQARVVTSITELRGFRIEGLASVRALGIRARTRIDIIPSMLSVAKGVRLDAAVRWGNDIFIEKRLEHDFSQTVVARADCSMLGFAEALVEPDALPPKARMFRLENSTLPLFDRPSDAGATRWTLTRQSSAAPVLFFALQSEGNWVDLRYDGEVQVRAWANKRDLVALPPGELQDQLAPSRFQRTAPKLAPTGTLQLTRAAHSIPLRAQAAASAPSIGEIEPEVEFYVVEVVAGWASVVPRSLGVMPALNRQFWIEAKQAGLWR